MNKFKYLSASLLAAAAFTVTACDSDTEETPDVEVSDTNDGDGAGEPGDDTEGPGDDTEEPGNDTDNGGNGGNGGDDDACEAVVCSKLPTCNEAGQVVTYTPSGCTDGVCEFNTAATDCDAGEVCANGACFVAGDACEYDFGERLSIVTTIEVVGDDSCCFDFNGDQNPDNALGKLLAGPNNPLSSMGGIDVNEMIADQIETGALALVLELLGVDDINNAASVTINGFYGEPNPNGTGTLINASSFAEGSKTPLISFDEAKIADSILSAGPSVFTLSLPVLDMELDLAIQETRFAGEVAEGALGADKGVELGGEEGLMLGGYVTAQTLADAFNGYLEAECSCLVKTAEGVPYIGLTVKGNTKAFVSNVADTSACEEEICTMAPGLLGSPLVAAFLEPDVASEGDLLDAYSIGVRMKAVAGTVDGFLSTDEFSCNE